MYVRSRSPSSHSSPLLGSALCRLLLRPTLCRLLLRPTLCRLLAPCPKPNPESKLAALEAFEMSQTSMLPTPLFILAGKGCCDSVRLPPRSASNPCHAREDIIMIMLCLAFQAAWMSETFQKLTKSREPISIHLRKQMKKNAKADEKKLSARRASVHPR